MRGRWLICLLFLTAMHVHCMGVDDPSLVARWDFGSEEVSPLASHGGVIRDQPGPRPPEFPDFARNNTSVKFDGQGSHLAISDSGEGSRFDFTHDDAITIEAWIKLQDQDGHPRYIIGKGRTGGSQFARDNQNWSLRVVGKNDGTKLSFLFATSPGAGESHWHRWTSQDGFEAGDQWHHVAVTYRFGNPHSIRGWIDGQPTDGTWDMGGPTKKPPVVDDDAVWIGSSRGGSPGNSFRGWLDAVVVRRSLANDPFIAARFHRKGGPRVVSPLPEVMPDLGDIASGRVLVTFSESFPQQDRWLNAGDQSPKETSRWLGDEFLLPRIPLRYDDWGIRASWNGPVLVRMAADVELPLKTRRLLLHARGLSRLWVDGTIVARTQSGLKQAGNGDDPMTPLAEPPLPGLRAHRHHQQEVFGETMKDKDSVSGERACNRTRRSRVVLELIVGGKGIRTETGEVCVAIETQDGKSFNVLRPTQVPTQQSAEANISRPGGLPLTDVDVEKTLARIESSLSGNDDETRRDAARSQDGFWEMRHAAAREWVSQHAESGLQFPASQSSSPNPKNAHRTGVNDHPIDHAIAEKIQQAIRAPSQFDRGITEHFHSSVLPILREQCFRCHGEKDNGGLRLDSRAAAMLGGDSEMPAVAPGDLAESELIERIRTDDDEMRMPPTGDGLTSEQISVLEEWIQSGADWPAPPVVASDVVTPAVIDDEKFLRRIFLDLVGVPPTEAEAEAFLAATDPAKRERLIHELLNDDRGADHWMSFWLDLLAENPTLLNASLNSTGPFRWFLHDALRDNKPVDRMVTELLMMRGSVYEGGSAGFALAAENDAPFAAKGHIVASAFLGIDLTCARCHDSPYHRTLQRDLYSIAAMLERKPVTVPKTSRVPLAFFENMTRQSLIHVSLAPDVSITPDWPFEEATGVEANSPGIDTLMMKTEDSRERLAASITAPQNRRFSRVLVNRIWKRLVGAGFVEPLHDWEGREPSHSELLDGLAGQLITHDYDVKHIIELIVTSKLYQREAIGRNLEATSNIRFFNAPERRRLSAEQIVDSLYVSLGATMDVGELTFVHDGRRTMKNRLTLGTPRRAWMLCSLSNERDRPSLALPRARMVTDVLQAFGWTGSRQKPVYERESESNVLQPGVLANGTLSSHLTRAAEGSELAQLAIDAESPEALIKTLFLRVLNRRPKSNEQIAMVDAISQGFNNRVLPADKIQATPTEEPLPLVTWFNHLQPEANTVQLEVSRRVRKGPSPDPRLQPAWREIYEDIVWSLINHGEFAWIP